MQPHAPDGSRDGRSVSPFVTALGEALTQVAPAVRQHLALTQGKALHEGVIRRMWRRGPLGRFGGLVLHLDGGASADSRIELRNEIVSDGRGGTAMVWQRTHYVAFRPVHGIGRVHWDPSRNVLIDGIGRRRWLEVELVPTIDGQAVAMAARRQWLRIAGFRLPLPEWLTGTALTREWQEPDGRIGLSLTLRHPVFGEYAGYEAVLTPSRGPS